MAWSRYQEDIFRFGEQERGHLVVVARAGSGKTTTIKELCRRLTRSRILVCAFNNKIRDELALKLQGLRHVQVKGMNQIGFGTMIRFRGQKLEVDRYRLRDFVRRLVPDEFKEARGDVTKLVAMCMANLAVDAEGIEQTMFAYDLRPTDPKLEPLYRDWAAATLAFSEVPAPTISFDEQVYLPAKFNLTTGAYDVVIVDEAQDLNACQYRIVMNAVKPNTGRVIAVGDDRQCHPPGVEILVDRNGTRRPIETLCDGDVVCGWNRNAQKMVDGRRVKVGFRQFSGELTVLRLGASRTVPMTPEHRVLARWSDRTNDVCVTYVMYRADLGYRVGWCQLFASSDGGRVRNLHLAVRARIEKADAVWVLRAHASRTAASVYESVVAARYGLPTAPFEPVNGAQHLTADAIQQIFAGVGTSHLARAEQALRDHGRDPRLPLYPFPPLPGEDEPTRGRRTYFPCYAANVLPALMSLPLPQGQNTWVPVEAADREPYTGTVYSLDVDVDHAYAANDVVVLNCIYGFRGADSAALDRFKTDLKATVLPLSVTYRCPRAVVDLARRIVPDFEAAPGAIEGVVACVSEKDFLARVSEGDAVISRTNAALTKYCMMLLGKGRRARIIGRDLGSKLDAMLARTCTNDVRVALEELGRYVDEESERLIAARKDDKAEELVDNLEALRAISEDTGSVEAMRRKIAALFDDDERAADKGIIPFMTVHKAKGLEFERVWMFESTFRLSSTEGENLYYVAATRAQRELYLVQIPRSDGKVPKSIAMEQLKAFGGGED